MKAAVFYGQRDIRVIDRDEPVIRPGTVKIDVEQCGICGTDLHEYLEGPIFIPPQDQAHPITAESLPIIMGHEFAGTISDVGDGVTHLKKGDRVAVDPIYSCGKCRECERGDYHLCRSLGFHGLSGGGGGFAGQTVVRADRVYPLGDLSADLGALVEPLAVAMHAVRKSGLKVGDSAVVYGAGPIGQAAICCLKAAGAGLITVVEVAASRQKMAGDLGADLVLDPTQVDVIDEVLKVTGNAGADVALDCAGLNATVQSSIGAVRRGGTVVMVAVWGHKAEMDMLSLVLSEVNLVGSIAYNGDFDYVIKLLKSGIIDPSPMITKRIKLDEIVEGGFEELIANRDQQVKILVDPR